ncbi:MAG: DUF1572 family protein [Saprospiraceae bacterium]|nr:DUF1572 family protein [Saprospiraceae bacterium]
MDSFIDSSKKLFLYYKSLGEKAMNQINDDMLFFEPTPGINSIAIIVRHLQGNMKSRWTDFLTSDGEKPWRNRDEEFEEFVTDRTKLMLLWEEGWQCLFDALDNLSPEDLNKEITIRNQAQSVMDAVQRQIAHYAYHVGQIVYISKINKGDDWQSLSIPKNNSETYNAVKFSKDKEKGHFTDEFLK